MPNGTLPLYMFYLGLEDTDLNIIMVREIKGSFERNKNSALSTKVLFSQVRNNIGSVSLDEFETIFARVVERMEVSSYIIRKVINQQTYYIWGSKEL